MLIIRLPQCVWHFKIFNNDLKNDASSLKGERRTREGDEIMGVPIARISAFLNSSMRDRKWKMDRKSLPGKKTAKMVKDIVPAIDFHVHAIMS